jgi:hypothetical protein
VGKKLSAVTHRDDVADPPEGIHERDIQQFCRWSCGPGEAGCDVGDDEASPPPVECDGNKSATGPVSLVKTPPL